MTTHKPTRPDQARPDQAKPDLAKPDLARPDLARPDQVRPDLAKPEAHRSAAARAEAAWPDRPGEGYPHDPTAPMPSAAAAAATSGSPFADEPDPFAVLEALSSENSTLKDRLLRALADTENMRRRTEKEVADARTYAVTNFARDMVNVADNMRRALDALPAADRASLGTTFAALLEGIEVTERDLLKTLERHGVKRLDPAGGRFDPHLHQAMFEIADASVPTGTVMQVVQPGYVIGDRVLRPALVGVSKGGPKAGAQPQSGDAGAPPSGNGAAD